MEQLLLIDPQNDFCHPDGTLFVPNAPKDIENIIQFIKRKEKSLKKIFVSLDSHHSYDIAHPLFWKKEFGQTPNPFTHITLGDCLEGRFLARNPEHRTKAIEYLTNLEKIGRLHTIWPEHCLIGTWGHNINEQLQQALAYYEDMRLTPVEYVLKGMNSFTEHYSVLRAIVSDSNDAQTEMNHSLLRNIIDCDRLYIAGEAFSHCLAETIDDLVDHLNPEELKKITILTDCTSPVPGYEALIEPYLKHFQENGITISTTEQIK